MKQSLVLLLLFFTLDLSAQSFLNPDLNGIAGTSYLPYYWQSVPYTDTVCLATSIAMATVDVTNTSGPLASHGINGNPYSGNTFVSGLFGSMIPNKISHEGLMQTVNGFTVGCNYSIQFYQTVVKQINYNFLDTSGVWLVYVDTTLIATTAPTVSQAVYNSNALNWEQRLVSFTATDTVHTIKFLPYDDDADSSSNGQGGGLRMGIDSIYLLPVISNLLKNDTSICLGDTFTMDVTNQNATYLWQDGSTNSAYSVTTSGTYWVQISTPCAIASDTIHITSIPPPILNLGNDTVICQGNPHVLQANYQDYSIMWQDSSSDSSFTVSQTGTYWVELTNQCGVISDTININYSPLPIVNLGNDTSSCIGDSITLTPSLTNATYIWSDSSTNSSIIVQQSGSYWVLVTQNGCVKSDTINMVFNSLPSVDLGADTTLCQGDSLVLDASFPNYTYTWQNSSTSPTLTVNSPGLYSVTVEENNCFFSDSIQLNFNPLPTVSLGNDTVLCTGDSFTLNVFNTNYTYLWNDNSTNAYLPISQLGLYWVTVELNNCYASDSINVSYTALPIVDLGNDTSICDGEKFILSAAQNGYTYLWQDNSTNSTFLASNTGTYWVRVTENNCTKTDTINIQIRQLPIIELGNDTTLCQTDSLLLDATNTNYTYQWQNATNQPTFIVATPGQFWVKVFDGFCSQSDTISVAFNNNPSVYLGEDIVTCKGTPIILDAYADNYTYLWSNNSTSSSISPTETGIYWVRVHANNCYGFDTIQIELNICKIILELPNIVTPNNDGLNEVFTPKLSEGVIGIHTKIYNRWGDLIFETEDVNINWHGNENSDGVYYWVVKYWGKDLITHTQNGTVTIVR